MLNERLTELRTCLLTICTGRPEVCRTYNFGEFGSSEGQFFRQFLQPIVLANESVPWGQMDLSYLEPGR